MVVAIIKFGVRFIMCPRCSKLCRPLRDNPDVAAGHVRAGTDQLCKAAL